MMLNPILLAAITTMPQPPCSPHAMAPSLAATSSGAVLTWMEPAPIGPNATSDDVWRLRISEFNATDNSWSTAKTITQRRNFFVNWADTPQVAISEDGSFVSTWLQKSGGDTYAYDIGVARSIDSGHTWTMLGTLNDDRVKGEHGFVSMVPSEGGIRAIWLDGRAMASEGHGHESGGDMSLRTAMITDTIGESSQLDNRTCECCPTTLAVTPEGVLAAYRDRDADDRRDISLVRLNGNTWSAPADLHRDDWQINGCPVNGPDIDALGQQVVIAWYTGGENPGVFTARSSDGGKTFAAPQSVGTEDAIGRVAIAWRDATIADVVWIESGDEDATLQHARTGKTASETKTIATVPLGRRSGYPRIAPIGEGRSLLVWTALDPKKGLQTRLMQ